MEGHFVLANALADVRDVFLLRLLYRVYLDWFPSYLSRHRGYNLKEMGFYASLPLFAGTAGDLRRRGISTFG